MVGATIVLNQIHGCFYSNMRFWVLVTSLILSWCFNRLIFNIPKKCSILMMNPFGSCQKIQWRNYLQFRCSEDETFFSVYYLWLDVILIWIPLAVMSVLYCWMFVKVINKIDDRSFPVSNWLPCVSILAVTCYNAMAVRNC